LALSRKEGELLSSPELFNPQNSPKGSRHPTPPHMQTPPATLFFSDFTSRLERAIQQIISNSRKRPHGISIEGTNLETSSGVELQNFSNIEEPLKNLDFQGDMDIRNLFSTPSFPLPFDAT
jgi:hypothetical protein